VCRPRTGQAWRRPTCTHLPPGGPKLNEPGLFSDEHTWAEVLSHSAGLSLNKVEDNCSENKCQVFFCDTRYIVRYTNFFMEVQLMWARSGRSVYCCMMRRRTPGPYNTSNDYF